MALLLVKNYLIKITEKCIGLHGYCLSFKGNLRKLSFQYAIVDVSVSSLPPVITRQGSVRTLTHQLDAPDKINEEERTLALWKIPWLSTIYQDICLERDIYDFLIHIAIGTSNK